MFDFFLDGTPTSVDFVRDDPNRMVTSYTSAACIVFDLETGQPVTRLDTDQVRSISFLFFLIPSFIVILDNYFIHASCDYYREWRIPCLVGR